MVNKVGARIRILQLELTTDKQLWSRCRLQISYGNFVCQSYYDNFIVNDPLSYRHYLSQGCDKFFMDYRISLVLFHTYLGGLSRFLSHLPLPVCLPQFPLFSITPRAMCVRIYHNSRYINGRTFPSGVGKSLENPLFPAAATIIHRIWSVWKQITGPSFSRVYLCALWHVLGIGKWGITSGRVAGIYPASVCSISLDKFNWTLLLSEIGLCFVNRQECSRMTQFAWIFKCSRCACQFWSGYCW